MFQRPILIARHRTIFATNPRNVTTRPKPLVRQLNQVSRKLRTPPSTHQEPRNQKHNITRIALSLLNLFLVGHLITTYVVTIRACAGPSMLPTIAWEGDWIILSKLHRYGRGIEVGDMISFHHPVRQGVFGIKRVIGMPGDFVLRDTPRTVYGEKKGEEQGAAAMVQVPEGHCWIVGDNLDWSRDSRMFGPVPLALVRGKVVARFWPRPKWFENALHEPDPGSDAT